MSFNIEIESGTTARLLVGGKYCDRDIVVTAKGGGDAADVAFLDLKKTITEYRDDTIVKLPDCAFCGCTNLKMVVLPKVEDVNRQELFVGCLNLAVVDFTALTRLGECSYDEHASGEYVYTSPLPDKVKALVNRGGLFQMGGIEWEEDDFSYDPSCGVATYTTEIYVYVPRSYITEENLSSVQFETDWGTYGHISKYGYDWEQLYNQNRIRAIEDYTVDGTVTGELDLAKMGIDMG